MAAGKRGKPTLKRKVLKEKASQERQRQEAKEVKSRRPDLDRWVQQAYKEIEDEEKAKAR
eukprot:157848-Rhodomonas_salina.2